MLRIFAISAIALGASATTLPASIHARAHAPVRDAGQFKEALQSKGQPAPPGFSLGPIQAPPTPPPATSSPTRAPTPFPSQPTPAPTTEAPKMVTVFKSYPKGALHCEVGPSGHTIVHYTVSRE